MPRRCLSTRTGLRTVLSRDAGHQCHTWRPPTYRLERSPLHACRQRWQVEKHSGTFVQGRRGPQDSEANSLRMRTGAGWGGALFLSLLTPILGVALYAEHTLKHQQLESLRTEWRESAAPRQVFPLQVLGTSEDHILNHL